MDVFCGFFYILAPTLPTMIPRLFEYDQFLIDENVQFLKFHNEYKIYNNDGLLIGSVEQKIAGWQKLLMLFIKKSMMPFYLEILDESGAKVVSLRRGWTFWMSKITLTDQNNNLIGFLKQQFKFFKPTFIILNSEENPVAAITGDWKAWDFKIVSAEETSIGTINKKWNGVAKELFTNADKYTVSINPEYNEDLNKVIILSAAITIDMVLKEQQ